MNFLHTFYPSLLKVPGFLVEFITPIIKVNTCACYYATISRGPSANAQTVDTFAAASVCAC
jgi:hypothetical protein